jgi:hypothetical protein
VLLLVVLAFVAYTGWDLAERWQKAPATAPHVGWALASLVPLVVMSVAQALGWIAQVHRMVSHRLAWVPAMELFLAAMLGRYSPAKVGLPAILIARAKQVALSPTIAASAMVLVLLVYTLLGLGLGVGTLATGGFAAVPQLRALGSGLGLVALGGMALGVVLLVVVDRSRWPMGWLRRLGVEGRGSLVGLAMPTWYAVAFAGWWLHGLLVVRAVGGDWAAGAQGAGLFVLAPVLGFLALIAPGGLGVREAVVAGGLAGVVGSGPAVVAALLSRILAVAVDVGMWAALRWAARRQGTSPPPEPAPASAPPP